MATSSMDCTTEHLYFSQSMEWGSSQNFTLQPVNPWKKSMNRTGPYMGGSKICDEGRICFFFFSLVDLFEIL